MTQCIRTVLRLVMYFDEAYKSNLAASTINKYNYMIESGEEIEEVILP